MRMKTRVVKVAITVLVVGVLVCGLGLGVIARHCHMCAQENCQIAQQAHPHPGDDVAALIDFMNSAEHSLWDRNHKAIWTLGQLRDPKALPALEAVSGNLG